MLLPMTEKYTASAKSKTLWAKSFLFEYQNKDVGNANPSAWNPDTTHNSTEMIQSLRMRYDR